MMRLARGLVRTPSASAGTGKTHRARIAELWNGFIDSDEPYVPVVRVDDDGHGSLHVFPDESIPLEEISLEFGAARPWSPRSPDSPS
jgi:hypothetical protein